MQKQHTGKTKLTHLENSQRRLMVRISDALWASIAKTCIDLRISKQKFAHDALVAALERCKRSAA